MFHVPHAALGAELTLDYNERTSLFGIQACFMVIGTIIGSWLPDLLQTTLAIDARTSYKVMGITYAVLMVVVCLPLLLWVKERPEFVSRESNPLIPGVRRAFRNRPFRIILLSSIAFAIPAAIPGLIWPYWTYYVIQPENPERWLMIYLVSYYLVGFVCLPLWVKITQRIGKRSAYLIMGFLGTFGNLLYFWMGPGREWYVFWVGIVAADGEAA
jgi:Na+/melibiose symporter-like transporter